MKTSQFKLQRSKFNLLFLLLATLLFPGCRGCNSSSSEQLSREELEKRRREQKDALIANDIVSLPTDTQRTLVSLKPGHWVETTQKFKSTREDLQVLALGSVFRGDQQVALPATNFVNEYHRRTVLPKGQEKSISLQFFVPMNSGTGNRGDADSSVSTKRLAFGTELVAYPLMNPIAESSKRSSVNELKENEFQMAVMSPQSLSYQFLAGLDAVYWAISDFSFSDTRVRSYEVSLVEPKDNLYAIPHSLLTMTSLAVIVWDDVASADLSEDQQRAIIDWLHWGGQLVISGPTSWARLQNSFLSTYLPAFTADSVELTTDAFAALSQTWITQDLGKLNSTDPIEIIGPPVAGLRMKLSPQGSWLPGTGELVAEARVGRGRIVVTGFPLREARVYQWPYFSSFFSTGILRRWPRTFRRSGPAGEYVQSWASPFEAADFDPRMHSNVRILTRDLPKTSLGTSPSTSNVASGPEVPSTDALPLEVDRLADLSSSRLSNTHLQFLSGDEISEIREKLRRTSHRFDGSENEKNRYEPGYWDGAAAWNDYSGLSDDAVEALRAAAGIELPSRATILKLLGGYLLCLVPLNYLMFRMIRRLEFAWLAAPVLALIGVVVVTRVAQLDIGFARRTIDLGVLELYHDHPRGHLTQYLALYTSLSTNYSMEFPEVDSAALPLGDVRRETRRAMMSTRQLRTTFGKADGVVLEPVTVFSNSTEMLRSEQVLTLNSSVRFETTEEGVPLLINATEIDLEDCLLLRMNQQSQLEFGWLGMFKAASRKSVSWQAASLDTATAAWHTQLHSSSSRPTSDQLQNMQGLWIGGLLNRIARKYPLLPGACVMIGHTRQTIGNLKVTPRQDQYDSDCIVVVHLSQPDFNSIQPDVSIISRGEAQDSDVTNEKGYESSTEIAPARDAENADSLVESTAEQENQP